MLKGSLVVLDNLPDGCQRPPGQPSSADAIFQADPFLLYSLLIVHRQFVPEMEEIVRLQAALIFLSTNRQRLQALLGGQTQEDSTSPSQRVLPYSSRNWPFADYYAEEFTVRCLLGLVLPNHLRGCGKGAVRHVEPFQPILARQSRALTVSFLRHMTSLRTLSVQMINIADRALPNFSSRANPTVLIAVLRTSSCLRRKAPPLEDAKWFRTEHSDSLGDPTPKTAQPPHGPRLWSHSRALICGPGRGDYFVFFPAVATVDVRCSGMGLGER